MRLAGWQGLRAAAVALLVGLALMAAGCATNPVTGQDQFVLMSEAQELSLGKQLYPQTTQSNNGLPANDPRLQAYVSQVGTRLARLSHRPDLPWEFNVVNSSNVNAFALPGGKISITRGLITRMDNEDQLAFVLGHEIGHVTARHQVSSYTRGVLAQAVLLGVVGALGDSEWREVGAVAAGVGGAAVMAAYSRDDERQADQLGLEYMTKAGYNPGGGVQALQILQSLGEEEPNVIRDMFATHPMSSERVATARQRVAQAGVHTGRGYQTVSFNRALALQMKRAPAYAAMDKGDALRQSKKPGQAVAQYQRAIRGMPREGLFYARLARCYLDMNQPGQARSYAQQAASLSPNLFEANMTLGQALSANRQYAQALSAHLAADRLLQLPGNRYRIAQLYEKTGNRAKAYQVYQAVASADGSGQYGQAARKGMERLQGAATSQPGYAPARQNTGGSSTGHGSTGRSSGWGSSGGSPSGSTGGTSGWGSSGKSSGSGSTGGSSGWGSSGGSSSGSTGGSSGWGSGSRKAPSKPTYDNSSIGNF